MKSKAFSKRLKVTKNGKILARKGGQNHFNAKEGRRWQLHKKRSVPFVLTNKAKARFL
jgi:ribosomal protein L35